MPHDVRSAWSMRAGTARVMVGTDDNIYVTEDRLRATDEHPFMVTNVDHLCDALKMARDIRDMVVRDAP